MPYAHQTHKKDTAEQGNENTQDLSNDIQTLVHHLHRSPRVIAPLTETHTATGHRKYGKTHLFAAICNTLQEIEDAHAVSERAKREHGHTREPLLTATILTSQARHLI